MIFMIKKINFYCSDNFLKIFFLIYFIIYTFLFDKYYPKNIFLKNPVQHLFIVLCSFYFQHLLQNKSSPSSDESLSSICPHTEKIINPVQTTYLLAPVYFPLFNILFPALSSCLRVVCKHSHFSLMIEATEAQGLYSVHTLISCCFKLTKNQTLMNGYGGWFKSCSAQWGDPMNDHQFRPITQ